MVTPELIERIKQVNVSKDSTKTAERVKTAFSSATRKQKHEIERLSGQKRTSVYRVFKTGNLSAKVLLPMAEILNITPFWFTGETDDMDKCSDTLILSFLDGRGYKNLASLAPKRGRKPADAAAAGKKPGRKPRKAAAVEAETAVEEVAAVTETEDENAITIPITLSNAPKMREAINKLDAESAAQLLRALYLRAKAGGNAEQLLDVVKLCLLS
jgi:hypothetical protein